MKSLRKAVVQFRMEEGEDAQVRVGSRTLYHFWSLLSPFFKPVFLPPQRKTDGEGITWSWEQPQGDGLPTSDELKGLRRRVSDGHRQLVEALSDGPKGALTEEDIEELRARMGKIVAGLLAMPDRELMGYAANTPYGWMVHSWGAPWPGVPTFPEELALSISGSVTADGAPLQGAGIKLLAEDGKELTATRSDTTGRWSFPKLNPGRYLVTCTADRVEFPGEPVAVPLGDQAVSGIVIQGEARKGAPLEVLESAVPPPAASSPREGVSPWKALAVIVCLLLLAGGLWWWNLESDAGTVPTRKVIPSSQGTPVDHEPPDGAKKAVVPVSKVKEVDAASNQSTHRTAGLATASDNSADVEGVEDGALDLGGNDTKDLDHASAAKGNSGTGAPKKLTAGGGSSGKDSEKRGTPAIKPWATKKLVGADANPSGSVNANPGTSSDGHGAPGKGAPKANTGSQSPDLQKKPSSGETPQGAESEQAVGTPEPVPSPLSNPSKPTVAPAKEKERIQKEGTVKKTALAASPTPGAIPRPTPRSPGATPSSTDAGEKDSGAHEGVVGDQGNQASASPPPEPAPEAAPSAAPSGQSSPRLVEPKGTVDDSSDTAAEASADTASGDTAAGSSGGSSSGAKRPPATPSGPLPLKAKGSDPRPSAEAKPTPTPSNLGSPGTPTLPSLKTSLPGAEPRWFPSLRCVQSAWRLSLVSDEILETQPVAEGDPEEGIERLRSQRLRELRAQVSKTFKKLDLSNGLRFSVPGDARTLGLHWVKTDGGSGVSAQIANSGAEVFWPGAAAFDRSSWELRDGKEQPWVRVRVSQDREVLLLAREGVKAWCFCALVRAPGEDEFAEREMWSDRLRWQSGTNPLLPQSWVRDDDWKGGRGHRLEFPVSLTDPETPVAIRLHDTETRWCLEGRFEWVTP